jgi:hypothetical protein
MSLLRATRTTVPHPIQQEDSSHTSLLRTCLPALSQGRHTKAIDHKCRSLPLDRGTTPTQVSERFPDPSGRPAKMGYGGTPGVFRKMSRIFLGDIRNHAGGHRGCRPPIGSLHKPTEGIWKAVRFFLSHFEPSSLVWGGFRANRPSI